MGRISRRRVAALAATAAVAVGLVATASGTTGAYFTDTKSGTLSGTIGSVKVSTSGGGGADGLDLAFTNLLPGEAQTVTLNYLNTGTGPEDIWLAFPDASSLHALNNLGSYGQISVADSVAGTVFSSTNLNDNRPPATGTCGAFTPAGCWPLPTRLLVRSSVPAGGGGSVSLSFAYPGKLSDPAAEGGSWNVYPVAGSLPADSATSGSGLPYQVVATQPGQTP